LNIHSFLILKLFLNFTPYFAKTVPKCHHHLAADNLSVQKKIKNVFFFVFFPLITIFAEIFEHNSFFINTDTL